MLARVLFVAMLAVFMVALAALWWLADEPRRRADDPLAEAEKLSQAWRAENKEADRAIHFAAPSELLALLPNPTSKLETVVPAGGTLPAQEPDESTPFDAPSSEPGRAETDTPAILDAPLGAQPLPAPDPATAPNRPAALKTSATESLAGSDHKQQAESDAELLNQMRALNNPATADQAERTLAARGFAPNHLELARRFTSPEPGVRCDAVRSAISVRGIVARDWLLLASRDEHRDVRLTAISLMLTSGEAQLLGRVDQIALDDPDAEVRAVARRGLEQIRADR